MTDAISTYFDQAQAWPWLIVTAGIGAILVYGLFMKRRALSLFAESRLHAFLAPEMSRIRPLVRIALVTSAALCIGIAMLGPRWGVYFEEAHMRHLDLMICLDVSRSMLAEDAGMSRLDRAKDDIKRLLDRMAGASVGLVAFAGKSDLVCPLTDDFDYFRIVLDDVGPHTAPVGGTNIGDALAAARSAFAPGTTERAVILLTDGEDHGGTATDEAKAAHETGITVYAIGIGGTDPGGLVPIMEEGHRTFLQYQGQQVWSKLDPERLHAIARAGGGEYHPSGQVNNRERTLEWIYAQKLAPLLKQTDARKQVEQRYHRSHWFAAAALVLLMMDVLMRDRRSTPSPAASDRPAVGVTTP